MLPPIDAPRAGLIGPCDRLARDHAVSMAGLEMATDWRGLLHADPLPWLLDGGEPAVRHLTLRYLLGKPVTDPEVIEARRAAMAADPIAAILAAQHPEGWWEKPGAGYSPKYRSTVWSLMFLDQMGADGSDTRIARACEYYLEHAQAPSGGFASVSGASRPTDGQVIHCLNGNLLATLVGFGWLDDERVQRALAWQAAAITGDGLTRFTGVTRGPGFACGINEGLPCGWGATKAVLALARVPVASRTPAIARALEVGIEFLLSVDPATAMYPMGWGNTRPNASWWKLGFPSGYVADVLQVMEAVCEAGHGGDPRLRPAIDWLLSKQDGAGRFRNEYRYPGRMHIDIDRPREPSRWVTLRACRVLSATDYGASRGM
jgi:hypothetical protein